MEGAKHERDTRGFLSSIGKEQKQVQYQAQLILCRRFLTFERRRSRRRPAARQSSAGSLRARPQQTCVHDGAFSTRRVAQKRANSGVTGRRD
eukprot:4153201-Pleurochrysis_carterae.AAC.1